jgi:hypothetical protein
MKMSLIIQSKSPILRFWGNLCGNIADVFLDQSIKYGDMYEVEPFLDKLDKLHDVDNTIAWKDDD